MKPLSRALAGLCSVALALFVAAFVWLPATRAIGESLPRALLVHVAGFVVFGMTFALVFGWAEHRIERR